VPIDDWYLIMSRSCGPVVYAQQIPHKNAVHPARQRCAHDPIPTEDPTVFRFQGQVEASQRDDFCPSTASPSYATGCTTIPMRTDLWS
jgi:hypothetical protein